ncbi:phage antirepressor KilAC domain-containing protein [Microbacterium aurugineum]|uniref:phage antirepressor KilAC domain-containing protein n=1 Tax=Microbacterium aurugineum TaxID=2851642 RepID=UPI0020BE15E5|nr:phage antirepressor KilAC domain-containing protein [Microbacterium aurugineum]MCK8477197.1 phage antirepressor KilAC domain-containing protein [Microbacterium aurugineum]
MTALDLSAQLDDLKIITLTDGEMWSARDLMPFAGYTEWRNWSKAIDRAIASVNTSGLDASDHFVGSNKMVQTGSGARREIEDVQLTRYACYILFQNADGSKPEIAALQQYFAVQTRKQEVSAPISDDEIVARALQITSNRVKELEAKVAEDAPKVEYVEQFVDRDDVATFRAAASELGVKESELRDRLIAGGWVYRQKIGRRWSESKNRMVDEVEYRASSAHGEKFALRPQHNAPRHHNGQVRQTLYIRQPALPAIGKFLSRHLEAVPA